MALKAGYVGIKKTMIGLINSLSSAKIIKSFGDGLDLTSDGELNLTAASASKIGGIKVGEGLSIEDGVLSRIGGDGAAIVLDTKFDTGKTYNGKKVYGVFTKFYEAGHETTHWTTTGVLWFCDLIPANVVDFMLHFEVITVDSDVFTLFSTIVTFTKSTGAFAMNFSAPSDAYIYVEFTENEEEE